MRPTSTGHVAITSADPAAEPHLRFNYLSTERDLQVATDGVRTTRHIMRQAAMERAGPQEDWLGAKVPDADEGGLREAVRAAGSTIFHPVGTAKMGLASDPMAVVDARLCVHGVDGLRVIDASIMPQVTSGNTCTPTLMIAEKGAEMLLQDDR
jgi:choline dehydrogenase